MKKEYVISYINIVLGIIFFLYVFSSIRIYDFMYQIQLEDTFILSLFTSIIFIIIIIENKLKEISFNIIDFFLLIALIYYLTIQFFNSSNVIIYLDILPFIALYLLFKKIKSKYFLYFFISIIIGALIQMFHGIHKLTEPWQDASCIRGVFTNSSVWGGFMALCGILSIELFFVRFSIKKRINIIFKIITIFTSIVLISQLIYSNSRAGWFSFIVGLLFLFFRKVGFGKLNIKTKFTSIVLIILLIIPSLFFLYNYKKDSADGRLLIWKVSSNIIADFPLLGTGTGGFKANYMNYQTEYFRINTNSEYKMLADENSHAFNEFIGNTVEYGILGTFISLCIIYIAFMPHKKITNRGYLVIVRNLLAVIIVFSFFSYPLEFIQFKILVIILLAIISRNYPPLFQFTSKFDILLPYVFLVATCLLLCANTNKLITTKKWDNLLRVSRKTQKEKISEYQILYKHINDNPRFLYHYGRILNESKDFKKSIEILTKASKIQPKYVFNMETAEIYVKMGDTEKAEEFLTDASYMIPSKFLPNYMLMEMFYEKGDSQRAKEQAHIVLNKPIKILTPTIINMKEYAKVIIK